MTINLLSALKNLIDYRSKNDINEDLHSAETNTLKQQKQSITPTLDSKLNTQTVDESIKFNSEELLNIFRKAECCTIDGLNEYDDDFTAFTPLGDVITHEMKRTAIQLVENELSNAADLETEKLKQITPLNLNETQV